MTAITTNNIAFIGAGNTSWQLAHQFIKAGLPLTGIYARKEKSDWVTELGIEYHQLSDTASVKEGIVFLLVADSAIKILAQNTLLNGKILIHASGSVDLAVLPPSSGVFYPLQSLSKGRLLRVNQVPIYLESESNDLVHLLEQYCNQIGFSYSVISSEQRAALHLSAVMVNNFTNHVLQKAFDLAKSHKLNPAELIPLLHETIEKFELLGGKQAQTGPAKRKDQEVIDRHMAQLPNSQLKKLYSNITQSIMEDFDGR